jgi:hypothetical protein
MWAMRYSLFLMLLIPLAGAGKKEKQSSTAAECAAIRQYNDHARAELKGQKPGELEPECPPPKKATAKKPQR